MKLTDKQKEILQALVDGKEVEYYDVYDQVWRQVYVLDTIADTHDRHLRIKPEVPEDIIVTEFKKYLPKLEDAYNEHNVEYTYDGVTHELKSVRLIDAKVNKDVSVLGEKANTQNKPQPDEDGWISNLDNDTERWPEGYGIVKNTKLEVSYRDGTFDWGAACEWSSAWCEVDGKGWDIIKFRISKDQND